MTTQYFGAVAEPFLSGAFARVPQRRMPESEEVASAFVYLTSPGASGVTGAILLVDGGLTGKPSSPRRGARWQWLRFGALESADLACNAALATRRSLLHHKNVSAALNRAFSTLFGH